MCVWVSVQGDMFIKEKNLKNWFLKIENMDIALFSKQVPTRALLLAKGSSKAAGEEQGAGRAVSTMYSVLYLHERGKEAECIRKHTSPGSQRRLHLHQGPAAACLGFAGSTTSQALSSVVSST